VAVGHEGGLAALVTAAARALARAGAQPLVLAHPDGSRQAGEANAAGVEVYVGLRLDPRGGGCSTCYYAGYRYESAGGRSLAQLLQAALARVLGSANQASQGMSIPILRETRMPAVVCELGPGPVVVEHSQEIAAALVGALVAWTAAPCG
jgi:N-acetylmuramoyl-L-alanine amidase